MAQAWEIENFLDIRDNQLYFNGISAVALAREFGTPLFIFSEDRIRHNISRLKRAEFAIGCPLKVCYAAKANSTMGILRAVKDAGSDLEVNSGGELWKALEIGFTGDQIIFNGTSKEVWEIENAINAGIYAIQVDSLYELSLIEETAKRLGRSANVSLRLVPEIESDTHSGLQTALVTSKFGMMPDEAFSAFRDHKDSRHLNLCGIHLHVGSQNPDPIVYTQALAMLFDNLVKINSETGIRLKHINIGGGFPVNYSRGKELPPMPAEMQKLADEAKKRMDEAIERGYFESTRPDGAIVHRPVPKEFKEIAARESMFSAAYDPYSAISEAWKQVRMKSEVTGTEHLLKELTVLLEPGRSIIADAGICLTSVRNLKERPLASINEATSQSLRKKLEKDAEDRKKGHQSVSFGIYEVAKSFADKEITSEHWLLTDAGFNILLSMETYKWYYHVISAERADDEPAFPYKLAGPLCDGGDVYFDIEGEGRLPDYRLLPPNLKPGDLLALLNCGAYSLAQASQYNGRFLPAVVLIKETGSSELIRKRDVFGDLINNDIY